MKGHYLNPFYSKQSVYIRQYIERDPNPTIYKGYEIHHPTPTQFHIVKDEVCLSMRAGLSGAMFYINELIEKGKTIK